MKYAICCIFFAEHEKVESMKNAKKCGPNGPNPFWESKVEGLDQSGWGYQPNIVVKKQYQVSNTWGSKSAVFEQQGNYLEVSLCVFWTERVVFFSISDIRRLSTNVSRFRMTTGFFGCPGPFPIGPIGYRLVHEPPHDNQSVPAI